MSTRPCAGGKGARLVRPRAPGARGLALAVLVAFAGLASVLAWSPAWATPDPVATAEIDHLLGRIATSGCTFVRGGDEADGRSARAHLERKYAHARRHLASAEDFIRHVASASSLTGSEYRVRCGATESTSAAWLARELQRHRQAGKAAR